MYTGGRTQQNKFDVGDLVAWNWEEGKPPWHYIKDHADMKHWTDVDHGIIYDIKWEWKPTLSVSCYLVYWSNSRMFPVWESELTLIRKGINLNHD